MFPPSVQAWARGVAESLVQPLVRLHVTANTITVVGFFLNVLTAAVIASGHLSAGGVLLLFSAAFDMLDGAVARVSNSQSRFGAFLDSVLDRYSESAILLGLLYVESKLHHVGTVVLIYAVAVGSIMISYARARAEGLGLEAKVGIAPRPERVLILGIGLVFPGPATGKTVVVALWVLALITHFTAMQRLVHVWRQTQYVEPDRPERHVS
jgi:CDP-diacylglycerol---glycerol-3-phosphate 3-phosphatidyltransferase